ncbi:hypothetical protein CC78DRAFT_74964 [Lojkania enalia]|uniref:Uncharacterized protein n=1 Tax=Lojkania enalia TaxID=147567 RepID=A0A9P4MYG5_9PLEO|nr:hypothetical protein CC78DRAFT_74964 [Didymosphaeria enalia]
MYPHITGFRAGWWERMTLRGAIHFPYFQPRRLIIGCSFWHLVFWRSRGMNYGVLEWSGYLLDLRLRNFTVLCYHLLLVLRGAKAILMPSTF